MAEHGIAIRDGRFFLNGEPTYPGRRYRDWTIEGRLLNSRMVQGIFDDLNPETRARFAYQDGPWDPERNTREFLAAMPLWRRCGLLSFTINLQGGSPEGYSQSQPWHNSAFAADGTLRPAYMDRLARILDGAVTLGMAPIVGFFYFGQDQRLDGDDAVRRAVDSATDWIVAHGYDNVIIEIANECDVRAYDQRLIRPDGIPELIVRCRERSRGKLLVGTSFGGGTVPTEAVAEVSDVLLIHGNGVGRPDGIREQVRRTRALRAFRGQPLVYNEDDHFDFDQPDNNFLAALGAGASWGYFDYRQKGEGYAEGYQSVPVDWGINSARKRGFFRLLAEVTGSEVTLP
ncbi:MAG: hypothetical protein HZB16_05890 [Armatimonadetes bacterium]|nr:hypothetical protein [Armatimonadota bacterium]